MTRDYYHWKDTPLVKCDIRINRAMLSERGYIHIPTCKRDEKFEEKNIAIVYDREYVLAFIAKKLFQDLQIQNIELAQMLIETAWEYYQEKKRIRYLTNSQSKRRRIANAH
jgi:hypothetical protein